MPVIRISDQLNAVIRSKGHFGDTHDSILRKLLGIKSPGKAKAKGNVAKKSGAKRKLSLGDHFRRTVLRVLLNTRNHKMVASEALEKAQQKLKANRGKRADDGMTQKARHDLIKSGMLKREREGDHWYWELTKKGLRRATQIRNLAIRRRQQAAKAPKGSHPSGAHAKQAGQKKPQGKARVP